MSSLMESILKHRFPCLVKTCVEFSSIAFISFIVKTAIVQVYGLKIFDGDPKIRSKILTINLQYAEGLPIEQDGNIINAYI